LTAAAVVSRMFGMTRALRIGVVAPPWIPVPPETYGGTELVTDILCRGFREAGHHVALFASGDSTCPVERICPMDRAVLPPDKYKEHIHLAAVLRKASELKLDIIHSHLEGLQPYAPLLPCPVVCTLHVDVTETRRQYFLANQKVHYVAVSENQGASFPFPVTVIHHGIELERYPFRKEKEQYLAFLGEISRRKGADAAVKAWMTLAVPVKIAGYVPPAEEEWFKKWVMPRLREGCLEYLGPVGFKQKVDILSRAGALLCPIRWQEPFGLVVAEAMACGTPVVGMRRGAFPELIEDGVTGFLCDDAEDILSAAGRVGDLAPEDCRRQAEEQFDSKKMVSGYLELFEKILAGQGIFQAK
jgi:glycosyltransferase involved in cell wall biosynthesis